MEENEQLYLQLHKLSPIKSMKDMEFILSTLWTTRKTGLSPSDKSYVQSLLNLSSFGEVDPVLACLRSLIRKYLHENILADDMLKMFPSDLSLDLQSMLLMSLQNYQNQWKEEISADQPRLSKTSFPHQVNASLPPPLTSFPLSEISASLWPQQNDPIAYRIQNNHGVSTPIMTETNLSHLAPMLQQRDASPPDNLGTLPRLKSMTWTLDNRSKKPTNRLAVITLKLQDYTKSPLGETEVKFQLTRDTLEAMLRSMTYINEQLTTFVGSSEGALRKKQKQ